MVVVLAKVATTVVVLLQLLCQEAVIEVTEVMVVVMVQSLCQEAVMVVVVM